MVYELKLAKATIEKIREMIGHEIGQLDLETGKLTWIEKQYRKKTYKGNKIPIGSVIRIRDVNDECVHIIITNIEGDWYYGVQLVLKSSSSSTGSLLTLRKDVDVVFKNPTYKQVTKARIDRVVKFKENSGIILKKPDGTLVGKVISEEIMKHIISFSKQAKTILVDEMAETEKESADKKVPEEDQKMMDLEEIIERVETVDDFFELVGYTGILKYAAIECVNSQSSNIRKLLSVLQQNYELGGLTQATIKTKLNEELMNMCEASNFMLKQYTINYFLKAIVKGLKE